MPEIKIEGRKADGALIRYVTKHGGIVATLDARLKSEIKKHGGSLVMHPFTEDDSSNFAISDLIFHTSQCVQVLPTTFFASGSSIISASDLHSEGTLDMDNGGLEFLFLYPYFFGISPLSSNAGLESKSLICKVFCMQK